MFISFSKLLKSNSQSLLNLAVKQEHIKKAWPDFCAQHLPVIFKNKTLPLMIKKNTLTLECLDSVVACELCFRKDQLLRAVKKEFNLPQLTDLRFTV